MLSIPLLADGLKGEAITPDDPRYDEARQVFVGGIDRRPALIVRAANTQDVSRVIGLARDTGLELAVRSGGHSGAGHGVSAGGIVLDLADMREMYIDPRERTAWAETGLTAGEYTAAAARHGLATGFGDTGSVGIGGITLGGGLGLLLRKHGLTIDDVLAADVVTADGERVRADEDNRPDLFWAIRGGGGNFGVVTRIQYRLHEVDTMFGGTLVLPATPDLLAAFTAAALAAPDELSTIANVMPAPPLPFLPAEQHGQLVVMATLAYAGSTDDGERAVAPLRALATPIADMLQPTSLPEMFPPHDPDYHPVSVMRTTFTDRIDRARAEAIVEQLHAATAPMAVVQIRALGGAMARVPVEATAFAHRRHRLMTNVAAILGNPDERTAQEAWAAGLAAELSNEPGAYVGFLADEGEERVRAAYPGATWDRLAAIKTQYDPGNLFRLNQNITPAAG